MRRYLIFASAGLSLLMYSIDSTAVAVAFPRFMREFGTNVLWAGWTISIYFVAVTSVMPLAGKLSDTFGRKNIFLMSLTLFTAGSLACGLAPDIYSLVAFRFLQGVGGASFLPTAAGIVTDQFPEHRERAIGLFSSIFPIGGIVGPNLGGWIVSRYSWRYIFYINLPIGIGLIVLTMVLLKRSKIDFRPHIDYRGAVCFFGSILCFMLALNIVSEDFSAWSIVLTALFCAASLSLFILFLRQEKRDPNPILEIDLLKSKPSLAANIYHTILGMGVLGILNFIPYYATSVLKFSTFASGMILTPSSIGNICAATVISFLLRRWGYRWPMVLGLLVLSSATILLDQDLLQWRTARFGTLESMMLIVLFAGLGMGVVFPASNNACIELMPEKVATITGLRGMFRSVGGALGISLVTVILHLSSSPVIGFRITFISFGLVLLSALPLIFFMPSGRRRW